MKRFYSLIMVSVAIGVATWIAVYTAHHQYTFADDAFIFFRYADNIISGNGPVFNIGERVEGYTSPLWLGILCVCQLFGMNILHAATLLGMLLGIGIVVNFLTFPGLKSSAFLRSIAAAILCLQPWFMFWVTSGMETMLFTFLALVSVRVFLIEKRDSKSHFLSGLLVALTILTRPEGVILTPFLLLKNSKKKTFLVGLFPLILGYQIFRMTYFHSVLPNTATAKIIVDSDHFEMGQKYILQFFTNVPISFLAVLPAILAFFPRLYHNIHEHQLGNVVQIVLLIFIVYFMVIGGDFFQYHRFFVPLFPWMLLLATYGIHQLVVSIKPIKVRIAVYGIGTGVSLLLGSWNFSSNIFNSQHGIDWIVASGKLGVALRNQYPPTTLIAAPHIGALGYYSKLPLLDMLGLTDKYIANAQPQQAVYDQYVRRDVGHERFDVDYALRKMPSLFIPINGFSSVPATHISEVPARFAMEHVLLGKLQQSNEYEVANIRVDSHFVWIVLSRCER